MNFIEHKLEKIPAFQDKVTCSVIAWDDPQARPPLYAHEKPQESFNKARPRASSCDLVVVIFWSKMGTPLTIDGTDYESGTAWEFQDAINASVPVLLYRRMEQPQPPAFDMENQDNAQKQFQEFLAQNQKVQSFFAELKAEDGSIIGGVNAYNDPAAFLDLLEQHVQKFIAERLEKGGDTHKKDHGTHPKVVYQPTAEARSRYLMALRKHSLQIPLMVLGEATDFRKPVTLDQVFISLEVTQKNLDDLNKEDHWMRHGKGKPMLAVDAIKKDDRVVLLGDPGSGKSSLMKHLVARIAEGNDVVPGAGRLLPVFLVLRDLAPILHGATVRPGHNQRQTDLANVIVDYATTRAGTLQVPDFAEGIRQAFVKKEVFLVLDGLDEVPYDQRSLVREAVGALLNRFDVRRVIITCRIRSYTGQAVFTGMPTYTLAPLKKDLITSFVERWYTAQCDLGRVEDRIKTERIQDLSAVATNEPLLSLAGNPMLLTTMTIIHQQETVLPRERVKLYRKAVDLLLRRWQEQKGEVSEELAVFLDSREEKMRPIMERLAFEAHSPGDEAADLQRMEIIDLLCNPLYLGDEGLAKQFLDYVDHRSGLLIGRGGTPERPSVYSFPHRTFQEYLAGSYLIGARGAAHRLRELAGEGDFWSEAVLLGIEEQVYNSGSYGQNHVLNLSSQLSRKEPTDEGTSRLLLWTGKMAEVVGADVVHQDPGDIEPGDELLTRLQHRLVSVLGSTLPPIERAEAGRTLARLGDPREGIMTLEAMPFSHVPEGPFLMGYKAEQVDVPYGYWISQYPVTQAQYKVFVDNGGYEDKRWWTDSGWKELKEEEKRNGPFQYDDPVFQLANHPVVGVMWYEAYAFTQWLSSYAEEKGWVPEGMRIMLPNDPEWEKGARGGLQVPERVELARLDGLAIKRVAKMKTNPMPSRRYPWGEEITPNHCSYDETEIGVTSTPGCFLGGVSPYGVMAMSGNVYEWNRSLYESNYVTSKSNDRSSWENPEGTEPRVLRGGSFDNDDNRVRCAYRSWLNPLPPPHDFIGFRLVALPPPD